MNKLPRAEIEKICIQHYVDRGYSEADSISYLSAAINADTDDELIRIYNCILEEEKCTTKASGCSLQKIFGQK